MDKISLIFNFILAAWGLYLYLENNKLKGFESQKNLRHKHVESWELDQWYEQEIIKIRSKMEFDQDLKIRNLEYDYHNKKMKLTADIEYFDQLNNYKWLFGKNKKKDNKPVKW